MNLVCLDVVVTWFQIITAEKYLLKDNETEQELLV